MTLVALVAVSVLMALLALAGPRVPSQPAAWGSPQQFANAINTGFRFRRTTWDAAESPQCVAWLGPRLHQPPLVSQWCKLRSGAPAAGS